MKILVVDDNPFDRRLLRYNIEHHGHEAIEAEDGQDGLEKAALNKPDLIVSDVMMPRMDGFQFVKNLKEDENLRSIPVVFYSGLYTGSQEMELGHSLGAEAYIVKPMEPEELWGELNAVIERISAGAKMAEIIDIKGSEEFLKSYSHIVSAKLEEKVRELEAEIAVRRQTETALREAIERLNLIVEGTKTGLWDWDLSTNMVHYSREWKQMLGYEEQEVADHLNEWRRLCHPDDVEPTLATVHMFLQQPVGTLNAEFRMQHKSGEYRWILSIATPRFGDDGKPNRLLGLHIDITQRKKAEEALKDREHRYRALFENMLDGFAYCKMLFNDKERPVDFVYIEVNAAFERLTGLKDVVEKPVTEVIPGIKEIHPELFEVYGRVALTGKPERFEIYFKPLAIWLVISVYSPQEEYFIAIFDNITEHKKAEVMLKLSEERYRVVTESASDAIICINTTDAIYLWNKKAEEMFGYTSEEAIGKWMHQLIVPEKYREKAYEGLKGFYQSGTGDVVGKVMELTALRKDGSEFLVELSVSAMKVNGDWHATGIVRDITERKKAEEDLKNNLNDIKRMNKMMVDREIRMMELKKENEKLKNDIQDLKIKIQEK